MTNELAQRAQELRQLIFKTIYWAGGGHIPSSLSIAEILVVLYFRFLRVDPQDPHAQDRDRFILSKGHAGVALFSVLAMKGFFDRKLLASACHLGSPLGGHPDMVKVPGVDASTGSLGHGFPYGAGIAFAGKQDQKDYKVYCLLGDGECQEGSVWEAAIFAAQHKLDNLVAITDYNKLQAIDFLDNVGSLSPLADKWKAFGWEVVEVNGHDTEDISCALKKVPFKKGKPSMVIAHTVKGKGISFMENAPIWHYRMPNTEELKIALKDLQLSEEDLKSL
ncbi:MAG TPA: transketolase [Candidatus Omnitrophota bacterium]|nr:transketolase [Candidatus Omnitrophota bacterium]HQL40967.1 transketolase [Candidatus Omnitrophota bacterium]HQL40970.1 transketolase [Candidatus Omnitrophota bacterium]